MRYSSNPFANSNQSIPKSKTSPRVWKTDSPTSGCFFTCFSYAHHGPLYLKSLLVVDCNFEGSIIITANICICGFQTDFILCICVCVGGNLKSFFFQSYFFFYQISATISVILCCCLEVDREKKFWGEN
jgi:hypothetical protein